MMSTSFPAPSPGSPAKADGETLGAPATVPTVEVSTILGAGREAVIVHRGERYRLRVTANDKLILTK